jgi:quercetin dioxygenase-like cupin family protein
MQNTIISSLLSGQSLKRFSETWPEQCVIQHGTPDRLPDIFLSPVLQSIRTLTDAYQGLTMEADRKIDSDMTVVDIGATKVIDKGMTAYLGDIASHLPESKQFLYHLEQELGIPQGSARIGAFISPAGNGAPCHFDAEDVISIQIIGHKRFYTAPVKQIKFPYGVQYNPHTVPADELYPQMINGLPDYSGQEFEQYDMKPGSVLCIPRGFWHHTEADEDSLAISIIFSPPTQVDELIDQLKSTLLQNPDWRRPCYAHTETTKRSLNLYKQLPSIIDQLVRRSEDVNSPTRHFHLQNRFLRVPGVNVEINKPEDHWEISIVSRQEDGTTNTARMTTPKQTAEVFQWLQDKTAPFTTEQLLHSFPACDADFIAQILGAAEKAGLIRFLWFDQIDKQE